MNHSFARERAFLVRKANKRTLQRNFGYFGVSLGNALKRGGSERAIRGLRALVELVDLLRFDLGESGWG
ncbi:hypothetical protein L596_018272 [Steinernema carpocapsae]|uniref:Uncharacterized protein n=1 Tax=Steinernema carpocapsae TaxID=34508 RepID=A0A4U5N469_STECR|nr:hypothetical protein L596_018272 [Steinernema carpocapsae]